jgi:MFS family permease
MTTAALKEARRNYVRQTTPAARTLAVANPRRWLGIAAAVFVLGALAAGGGGALYGNGGSEIASAWLIALGSIAAFGALMMLPAPLWSRRHPQQAAETSRLRQDITDQNLRRHPIVFVVGLTLAMGVVLPLRLAASGHRAGHHHYSVATLVLVGVIAAVVALGMGGVLVSGARRRARSRQVNG